MTRVAVTIALLLGLLLSACATRPSEPSEQILGAWQSVIGGFTVTSTYTDTAVAVQGHEAMPYTLEGDRLTIDGDTASVRIVSFPSASEMIQLDPLTGVQHRFSRPER